jgi:competence protein ComFB
MEPYDTPEVKEKLILYNSLEEIVRQKTKEIVAKLDMCQCEKCYLDICALVLNEMPAKYVTTVKGNLMAKLPVLAHKKEVEITTLITKIAKMVQANPMH